MTVVESTVARSVDQLDSENPWPGLSSYDESSCDFFNGRATEADDLLRRILAEPVTVLFGKSGLGKTSLLNAGVFPRLREKGWVPILIRLQLRPDSEPLIEQVRRVLLEEMGRQDIDHSPAADAETLWEYLHRIGQEFWTKQNRLVRPLLVFDQFEELFTLGRAVPSGVERFREDLSDLAENRIPAALALRLGDRPTGEVGLDAQAMPYKIVIALREDFLADLEEWRLIMPSLRRNRMRLLPMGPDQALQAVFNERTSHLVSEPIARKIVAFLASGAAADDDSSARGGLTVEPALLSLFCQGVNDNRKRQERACFDDSLIERGKGTIVLDFYRQSVGDQPERVRQFIEEELITEHGFRNSYAIDSALARGSMTTQELDTLINRHLLRHEHHLGTDRVELTHDLLTAAVAEERDTRRLSERAARGRRERRKILLVAVSAALLALFFGYQWTKASRARDDAESLRLAAHAEETLNVDPALSILLAREGLRRADTFQARSALLNAAQYTWPETTLETKNLHGEPSAISLSPDGTRLVVLAVGGAVTVWDLTVSKRATPVWPLPKNFTDATSVAFSPDQTLIAVGRKGSVDLLDPVTGSPRRLPIKAAEHEDRSIGFSPDSRWLGWTLPKGGLQLWDIDNEKAALPIQNVGRVFTLLAGGTRVIGVSGDLLPHAFDRQRNGTWTPTTLDLSKCTDAASVSPGSVRFSATWTATTCTFDSTGKDSVPGRYPASVEDIVWSGGGRALVELLASNDLSHDLIVGREPDTLESRIKGAHVKYDSDASRLISVSEDGSRVALIDDDDEHMLVRIYSLAAHKAFLSPFQENSVAVAQDATWMVVLTPRLDNLGSVLEIVPLDQFLDARKRIPLDPDPQSIVAAQGAVAVTYPESRRGRSGTGPAGDGTTAVYDVVTGERRFSPQVGEVVQPLGSEGQLLLLFSASNHTWRVIRTSDGSQVQQWNPPRSDQYTTVKVSAGGQAVAVLRLVSRSPSQFRATMYAVRGENLTQTGELGTLAVSPQATRFLQIADDGRSFRLNQKVWSLADSQNIEELSEPLEASPSITVDVSPERRYEIQEDQAEKRVVRRTDKTILGTFPKSNASRFSDDDRWFASWSTDGGIQVLDLEKGVIAFRLDSASIKGLAFTARNKIVQVKYSNDAGSSILIPLDRTLLDRFAEWLVPRPLTPRERCRYVTGGTECRQIDLGETLVPTSQVVPQRITGQEAQPESPR